MFKKILSVVIASFIVLLLLQSKILQIVTSFLPMGKFLSSHTRRNSARALYVFLPLLFCIPAPAIRRFMLQRS
jgi:hypothetical protein